MSWHQTLKPGTYMGARNERMGRAAFVAPFVPLFAPQGRQAKEARPYMGIEAGRRLVQLRGFGFGVAEDGDIGVGVFPESEEIVVGSAGFGAKALLGVG